MNDSVPTNLVEVSVTRPQLALSDVAQSITFAQSFDIVDDDSAEVAAEELRANMLRGKAVTAMHDTMTQPFKTALATIGGWFKPEIEKCAHAERLWKAKLARFHEAQQERARQEQIRLRELQRLEQQRLAREAAKREEEARAQAEKLREEAKQQEAAGNVTASAELERRADDAQIAGQQDAQQMVEQLYLTPATATDKAKLPSGLSSRQLWSAEVFDLRALALACGEGKQPLSYVAAVMMQLDKTAAAQKDEMKVPGVRAIARTVIASRTKRVS